MREFDTFKVGLNQVDHTWLYVGIYPVSATDLVKISKDLASLVVYNKKIFLVGGVDFL